MQRSNIQNSSIGFASANKLCYFKFFKFKSPSGSILTRRYLSSLVPNSYEFSIDLSSVVMLTSLQPMRRSMAGTRNLFSCFSSEYQANDGTGKAPFNFIFPWFPAGTKILISIYTILISSYQKFHQSAWPGGYRLRKKL